jgi:hypothetical protein
MLYALWVLAGMMLLLWVVGVAGGFTVGAGIHILLFAALMAVMATLVTRPRVL